MTTSLIKLLVFAIFTCAYYRYTECAKIPVGAVAPKNYVVSLDEPPEKRWQQIALDHKEVVKDINSILISLLPKEAVPLIAEIGADLDKYIEAPYADEMRGIAATLNMSLGEIVITNLIYDISAFCTSIVSQDSHGQIWHSRNLDYSFGDILRNITVAVDFQQAGKTVYSIVTYAGYIGVMSGQRPMGFTVTVDERDQGSVLMNLLVALLERKAVPISFLVRNALAYDADFTAAVNRLANTPTAADAYFILGGVKPGEGAVITKGRLEADDIWRINATTGQWFVVETNYDHWTTPPPSDNRRTPAINMMKAMGQDNISVKALFNIMSTPPVLNSHTTYTIIMSAAKPELKQTWIRV